MARKAKDSLAQQSFEDLMQRLETVVGRLEGKGLTLEESLAAFEEGVALVRESETRLLEAEKKVEQLLAAPNGKLEVAPLDLDKLDAPVACENSTDCPKSDSRADSD